jgi:hypothetical protein
MNHMWNVILLHGDRMLEKMRLRFPRITVQAQQASLRLLMKSGLLGQC